MNDRVLPEREVNIAKFLLVGTADKLSKDFFTVNFSGITPENEKLNGLIAQLVRAHA